MTVPPQHSAPTHLMGDAEGGHAAFQARVRARGQARVHPDLQKIALCQSRAQWGRLDRGGLVCLLEREAGLGHPFLLGQRAEERHLRAPAGLASLASGPNRGLVMLSNKTAEATQQH